MNALATAPGVIATPGKYYIGAQEVMEYLDCKENKAYELIRQLRDELVKAGKTKEAEIKAVKTMKKDDLLTKAVGMGLEVTDDDTVDTLKEKIVAELSK